ncbi:hypothetical protein PIB30_072644 [Stylosanthes scabra]|uniref:Uncharacterized protein n=1 Tax=Stylosanthes scabra TaxID=79078 RepID=A0ABU6XPF6_9FABA|nr:hypothetical protein [Stylosanthes scabra]
MKSVEPRLTIAAQAERRITKLLGEMKVLNLQKVVLEEDRTEATSAKLKAEEELKSTETKLEALGKEKDEKIEQLERRITELVSEAKRFRGLVAEERVLADLAKVLVSELQKQCEDLAEDAKGAVAGTENALKAQLAILAPDFNTDQISFFKDIVDGKAPFPKSEVTWYGPSQLGVSLPSPGVGGHMLFRRKTKSPTSKCLLIIPLLYLTLILCFRASSAKCASDRISSIRFCSTVRSPEPSQGVAEGLVRRLPRE